MLNDMCTTDCLDFVIGALPPDQVAGRKVIEVGSYDANGSVRPFLEALDPDSYLGVDITAGPGVDVVCDARDLVERFGVEQFDMVVSTEMLEHVRPWRQVVHNLKGLLRPGGWMVLTTRSPGFEYHGWPYDFWRYEPADMRLIFSDMVDVEVTDDPGAPGVFVKARKPFDWAEAPLDALALHSIVLGRRSVDLSDRQLATFRALTRLTSARRTVTGRIPERQRNALKRALPWLVSEPSRAGAGPVVERAEPSAPPGASLIQ